MFGRELAWYEVGNAELFATLIEELPETSVVSIGHRPGLEVFHTRELTLEPGANGTELIYDYDTKAERTGVARLLGALSRAGIRIRDLQTTQSSLEDIFVGLVSERK